MSNDSGFHTAWFCAPADVEHIEYEIEHGPNNEFSPETVGDWIEKAIHREFARIDGRADYDTAVAVDVPDTAPLFFLSRTPHPPEVG